MSLVITSNVSKEEDLRPNTSNVSKPFSYQNRLLNTMKIPPMSEIALESCKITKNGLIGVSAANSGYNVFFGPTPGTDLSSSTMQPTRGVCGPEDAFSGGGRVERNPTDFARDITTGLRAAVYHPALVKKAADTSAVVCTVEKDTTDNGFKGFEWSSFQNTAKTTKTTAFTWKDISPDESSAATISATGNTVTATTAAGFYVQNRQQSISQNSGEVIMNFEDAIDTTQRFICGLSRINTDKGDGLGYIPNSYNARYGAGQDFRKKISRPGGMFFDICIAKVGNFLKVYQAQTVSGGPAVANGARQADDLIMKEIIYYGAAFGVAPFNKDNTPLDLTDTDFTKVKFTLSNEHIRLDLWNDDTSKYQLLIDNIATTAAGATNKNNLTLPRTASQWNMYPTMHARGVNAELVLESVSHYTEQPEHDDNTYTTYNWWGQLEEGGLTRWASEIDVRPWNDYSSPTLLTPKIAAAMSGQMTDYLFTIVTMPSDVYGREITQGANVSRVFGFDNQSVAFPVSGDVSGPSQSFVSANIPDFVSTDSVFVRLNNFTQSSVNARKGTTSKIIAHLPRFDNAGNETGALFFQPGEKTYVALNNPDTLYINSFDVDYVYENETFCKSLAGQSITVFHLRAMR